MRRNVFLTNIVLCAIALCLQGCPGACSFSEEGAWHDEEPPIEKGVQIYAPQDSVYTRHYQDYTNRNYKKLELQYAPNDTLLIGIMWEVRPYPKPSPDDSEYQELHIRKLTDNGTIFIINGAMGFYINGTACGFNVWDTTTLYGKEHRDIAVKYTARQIVDSIRTNYSHLVIAINDTIEHSFHQEILAKKDWPRIVIE